MYLSKGGGGAITGEILDVFFYLLVARFGLGGSSSAAGALFSGGQGQHRKTFCMIWLTGRTTVLVRSVLLVFGLCNTRRGTPFPSLLNDCSWGLGGVIGLSLKMLDACLFSGLSRGRVTCCFAVRRA